MAQRFDQADKNDNRGELQAGRGDRDTAANNLLADSGFMKVADNTCQTPEQMLKHIISSNLMQRIDNETGGRLRNDGVSKQQLENMLSRATSDGDKQVLGFFSRNFDKYASSLGSPGKLTGGEIQYMFTQEYPQCNWNRPPQGGGGQRRSKA